MIISIGAFDGFHRGHQKLFEMARRLACQRGTDWGVVSFSPHPQKLLSPSSFVSLFSETERGVLSHYLKIPFFRRLSFDRRLAELSPTEFLDYLADVVSIEGIVVGEDFRFGQGRRGGRSFLEEECRRRGWSLHIESPLREAGQVVSSSSIRSFIESGHVRRAADFLGYPFWGQGVVVEGDRRGRKLGFPTANISVPAGKIIPGRGVYAVGVVARCKWWGGALNVGFNPTFKGQRAIRFEVHLFGFKGDLYGEQLSVFLLERLRSEKRFEGFEALKDQMARDVDKARVLWDREFWVLARWNKGAFLKALQENG